MKLRNAKAAVSLLWKAGFSMRIAGPIQAAVFALPPDAVLAASPEGGFPLTEAEMAAQLECLGEAVS